MMKDAFLILKITTIFYNVNTLFIETSSGKHIPRALILDLDPTPVDELRNGFTRNLFHPSFLISGKEDSSHNFARATSMIGKEFMEQALDKVRKIAEHCEDFQGFMIMNSVGGGCGSGLGSSLLERLTEDYGKKTRMSFPIYPSVWGQASTVEPYNAVLGSHSLLEHSDVSLMMDNGAIKDICKKILDVQRPTHINFNRLIAKVCSSVISSFRFECAINENMSAFVTSMVPFQVFNFLVSSYSPLVQDGITCFIGYDIDQLTKHMFEPNNLMVKCDPRHGKYMACSIMYMGDVVARDINAAIRNLKIDKRIQFVDWFPSGFKVAMSQKMPTYVRGGDLIRVMRESIMIANTTAINNRFSNWAYRFDLMYKKRAFLHWYLQEGMEEQKFVDARERLSILEKDYEDAEMETQQIEEQQQSKQKSKQQQQQQNS